MSRPHFLLDEHVWGGLLEVGQRLQLDVVAVQSVLPEGTSDEEVLHLAAQQQRLLLTSNARDFAPVAVEWFLAGREHWGILIVPGETDEHLLSRILERIGHHYAAEALRNTVRFAREFI
jgi:predicted nuclease of predicted toxin-antitoxin system